MRIKKYPEPKIGEVFHNYTVVGSTEKNKHNNHRRCLCRCVCGEVRKVDVQNLYTENSKGCGCERLGSRLRPYESSYKQISRQCRDYAVDLTYEEYLEFAESPCHYCGEVLDWVKYNVKFSKNQGHHLDRKDNTLGYSKENCVVCCPRCNRAKSNHFTYEEWVQIGALIKSWKTRRI